MHAPDDKVTVETQLCQLHNVIQSTALEVLGRAHRQYQDWFDDNDADISNLLAEKNGLNKGHMVLWPDASKAAFFRCRRLILQRLREMQYAWMIRKAEEIQGSDGTTLLKEKSQILKRWAEHFRSVLNCSSAISDAAIDRLPQVDTNNDLDLPPSLPETIRAVQQISSGKAPGSDVITPEVYKHAEFTAMPTKPIYHAHPPLLPFLPPLQPPLPRMTFPPSSTNFSCPQCARHFNLRIGLVSHLRIHRSEAGEPVPGAPT
ncbi:unnamed protein product [Schistocephalus solidus]|uniref:C2H2-type domain-containing protein n=1 Tax=Schistocephalus solidus TaxID=70667 RepID=A0A3P7CLX7_SCHSO|nr:unnamed protein product [Schistocephalus solidus]